MRRSTGALVTELPDLEAANYARIEVDGDLTVIGFTLTGYFEMEVSGSKFAVTATGSSQLSDPLGLFTLDTEVDASLYISADGIATSIALTGSMSGLGFSFSGAMVFEA
ncbi:MAG: hypothetical protein ACYS9C_14250, partial [Planctomycetota bacterium]